MKLTYLSTLASGVLAVNAGAAAVITDFNDFTTGAINGQQGWVGTGLPDATFISAFDTTANGVPDTSNAATIGGSAEAANLPTVGFYHGYGEELGRTSVYFEFKLSDSVLYPDRDTFAFSLYDAGLANVFSILFVPTNTDASVDPGAWALFYSANGAAAETLGITVPAGGLNSFDLDFSPNGPLATKFTFSLDVVGTRPDPDPGPLNRGPNIFAVPNATEITSFGFEWIATDLPSGGGDNTLTVNNLTVVPEPSSALLLGIAGLAFVSNRRRHA